MLVQRREIAAFKSMTRERVSRTLSWRGSRSCRSANTIDLKLFQKLSEDCRRLETKLIACQLSSLSFIAVVSYGWTDRQFNTFK